MYQQYPVIIIYILSYPAQTVIKIIPPQNNNNKKHQQQQQQKTKQNNDKQQQNININNSKKRNKTTTNNNKTPNKQNKKQPLRIGSTTAQRYVFFGQVNFPCDSLVRKSRTACSIIDNTRKQRVRFILLMYL